MIRSRQHRWLDRFAWLTAWAAFLLIGLGGLVTSKEAGMAVPDWPTSYGYSMFLFPIHLWTGGIFYEHTHRLLASFVGLLTAVLALWLWAREPRPFFRWMGFAAFAAVVLQGMLGGLRVTLFKDQIGVFHAMLAQVFFVTVACLAFFASPRGSVFLERARQAPLSKAARGLIFGVTALVAGQLVLGATMRHQHAGLAVPDFPLAYGRIWPRLDSASVEKANQQRVGVQDYKPITAFQIELHMAHRAGALLTLAGVAVLTWILRGQGRSMFVRLAVIWLILICLQAALGVATVWSNKAADVATAHVLGGALSLLLGAALSVAAVVAPIRVRVSQTSGVDVGSPPSLARVEPRTT